ncbi:MAG: Glycine-tRNA ligase [Candidatus Woesebacteria bacterium GW2011_GWA1_39_21b]|uniref:Glycine-tRNA ligase n=1 Tax=Candidatus Woesebacteria bacterium GW2011_GWA1_39_21b TaxID=1618551 RepID=A0A0G0RHN2_9BACT|nr:MAG: Glycine-tRNA ligase [Candidatus Woesebacteria bacterium GW2011_GWA1_39_21b]
MANKDDLASKAREIYQTLSKNLHVVWDSRGNIGKRYFAQDEVGTPWCVTIDFQTLEDDTVTIRDRDTAKQERVIIDNLEGWFKEKLGNS